VGKHELLAAYEARKLNKPVLTIAFDSAAPENGGLEYAANNFFKFIDTRTLVEEHFVVRLVDLKNEKLSDNLIGTLSTEEPIYTLQAINGNILDTGRLYQNPDEGLKIVRKLTALIGF